MPVATGVAFAVVLASCGTATAVRGPTDRAWLTITGPTIIAYHPPTSNDALAADPALAMALDNLAASVGLALDSLDADTVSVHYVVGDTVRLRTGERRRLVIRAPHAPEVGYVLADGCGRWRHLDGLRTTAELLAEIRSLGMFEACDRVRTRHDPEPTGTAVGDPHGHVVAVHHPPWSTALAPAARLCAAPATEAPEHGTPSPSGRWAAWVAVDRDAPGGRLHISERATRRVLVLEGLPLSDRPLRDLAWLNERWLAVDRWSQPHHGVHYVLDVEARRLVLAAPFPDAIGSRSGAARP